MTRLKKFFNPLTTIFLLFAIGCLISSINEKREWNQLRQYGDSVTATIVDVVEDGVGDNPDHYVYFSYQYDGEEYTHVEFNYAEGQRIGKTVTAYVYPANPAELILYDGSTSMFFAWFMLGLALFFGLPALV